MARVFVSHASADRECADDRSPFLGLRPSDVLDDGGLTGLVDELLLAARARRLLVVVDQFEELLTQTPPGHRARFAQLLHPALARPVQVVATLRPEFLDQLLVDADLAVLPTHPDALRPLGRGGRLSQQRYDQLGGVQGALTRQADAALADASAATGRRREEVIAGLLRLVTVDEQGRPTRWRVSRDELLEPVTRELDAFVAARICGITPTITTSEWDQYLPGLPYQPPCPE